MLTPKLDLLFPSKNKKKATKGIRHRTYPKSLRCPPVPTLPAGQPCPLLRSPTASRASLPSLLPEAAPLVPSMDGATGRPGPTPLVPAWGSRQGPGAVSEAHGMAALCSPDTSMGLASPQEVLFTLRPHSHIHTLPPCPCGPPGSATLTWKQRPVWCHTWGCSVPLAMGPGDLALLPIPVVSCPLLPVHVTTTK